MNVTERVEPRRGLRWWIGVTIVVVGGIVVWALRFTFGYLLTPLSCDVGKWLQYVIYGVFLLGGFVLIAINVRLLRGELDRAERFLLYVAIGLNLFFIATMVMELSSTVVVDPCAKGAIP